MSIVIRQFSAVVISVLVFVAILMSIQIISNGFVSAADASDAVCDTLTQAGESCDGSRSTIQKVVGFALTTLSWLAGIIAVIMLIVSGLRFMTASGDPQSISSAKRGVIFALVGIVVVIISQSIVRFVVNKSTTPASQSVPAGNPNAGNNAN
jgi:uncharacterized membrane protein